jgi:riboflavin biosynthesis pyrimidine reductase
VSDLEQLASLYDAVHGRDLLLPVELASVYGRLAFPSNPDRPHVIANFVTTLDGVTSLGVAGQAGGGEISGFNPHDRMVMGLLRAVSDAVIIGAGTLRASPNHIWTAGYICPAFTDAYQSLRASLGKCAPPLTVIVTARGQIDLDLPVFQSGKVPVLIMTGAEGAEYLSGQTLPAWVHIVEGSRAGLINAAEILHVVSHTRRSDLILVEGGPRLMGSFYAEQCLDEQFLTLAPQVAGRDDADKRPGLVMGRSFAPDQAVWGTLASVKRAGSHLFLRYTFGSSE